MVAYRWVNASTLLTVSIATGFLPGARVLSRSRPAGPGFGVPPLPTPHCPTAHTGTAGHLQHWQPFGREQNDAGALHKLHRSGSITNDRFQADAILPADNGTKLLGHTPKIPYPTLMTLLFRSMHQVQNAHRDRISAEGHAAISRSTLVVY
jgi:hypothetical protein